MYSTGRIHKHACKFLYQLANHAKDIRNLQEKTLINYYVKLLNFALIKEATHTICVKSHEIGSYMRNANSSVRAALATTMLTRLQILLLLSILMQEAINDYNLDCFLQ